MMHALVYIQLNCSGFGALGNEGVGALMKYAKI